jgi:hypothetical protein
MNYLIIDDCQIAALGLKAVIHELYPLATVHISSGVPSSKEICQNDIVLLNVSSQPHQLDYCKEIIESHTSGLKLIAYFLELSDLNRSKLAPAWCNGVFLAADTTDEIRSVIQKSSVGVPTVSRAVLENYAGQQH